MKQNKPFLAVCLALPALAVAFSYCCKAQYGASGFNHGQSRPAEDPAVVARGKTLYGINCQACHGSDLRGGDIGGPNLLRSSVAMTDRQGENIVPIIQGARQAQGMPKIGISIKDSEAVAAYVRSVIGTIGRQGRPPGKVAELSILTGDAQRGQAYFRAHCAGCHSIDRDLRGVGSRYEGAKQLQAAWISGVASSRSGGTTNSAAAEDRLASQPTATVTLSSGKKIAGMVLYVDDFAITLQLDNGARQSFRRNGSIPAVEIHDPAESHRTMLSQYTDTDVHDVTAYLVTLK